MERIMDILVLEDFKLKFTFFSGKKGIVNLKNYNAMDLFKNPIKFPKFGLKKNGDLEWTGGFRLTMNDLKDKIIFTE